MDIIEKLDEISRTLNGIGGRLIVMSMKDQAVKEAHDMVIELGCHVDDLINELMEEDSDGY